MNFPIRDRWSSLFAPRDRRPIAQWAEDNIELPSVLTIRGKFNAGISRQFLGPLEALQDDRVRQVVVLKPTRGGGTLISDIWHCWCRMLDPGPAMVVMQTDEIAAEHAESRFMPMLLRTPGITALLSGDRHKLRDQSILFADGIPLYVTGPAISKLQTKGLRYITLSEAWLYRAGTIREAEARMGDFARLQLNKLFVESQAGVEDDDLDFKFHEGDCCEWFVQCLKCGHRFDAKWSGERADGSKWGMRWDEHKDASDQWMIRRCLESVRYECPQCSHPHVDSPHVKAEWQRLGGWVPCNSDAMPSKRSFHWRAILDTPWTDLASEFMSASNALKVGVVEPVIQFFQKRMAEPKAESTLLADSLEFRREAYEVRTEWPDEYLRFLTADRQAEDVFWVMVRAWAKTGESRTLYYGKVFGFSDVARVQGEFKVRNVGIDSGHMPKGDHGVYAACIRHGWIALRGSGDYTFTHHLRGRTVQRSYSEPFPGDPEAGGREGKPKVAFAKVVRFSAPVMSDRVRALIRRRLWIEPTGNPTDPAIKEYREQMAAEFKRRIHDRTTGAPKDIWVCPSHNNHAFDCAKMQVCLATIAKILPDTNEQAEQSSDEATPKSDGDPIQAGD